ncbi:MAG TPA: hypothetical protein VL992_03390 [Tepidisphaeraceae bacterium]|nr:hypothetical protein [Tepidisphaeraceae bacterium]
MLKPSTPVRPESHWVKLSVLVAMTAVLAVAIFRHVNGINGPQYWRWPWRAWRGWTPYLILILPAIPVAIAQIRFADRSVAIGIVLMMFTTLGIELGVRDLDTDQHDLTRLAAIIEEPGSIGYFTHAEQWVHSGPPLRDYLRQFPEEMLTFTKHARNKPPGSILFFAPFVKWAPTEDAAAMSAGLAIALLATLSVPATYFVARELTGDSVAAFQASACMCLCPGLCLFLPELDQFFPVYTALIVILWAKALKTGRKIFAIAFGLAFSFICFQTFNFLMMGIFVAGYAAVIICQHRGSRAVSTFLRQSAVIIGIVVAAYGLLWLWCGYNPIETLLTGIHTHHTEETPILHRDWPTTIPFDLTDFALGMGWVCVLLAVYYLVRSWRRPDLLVLLCLLQPIAVAITGLLATETARVWIFMMPLVMVPAGLELRFWRTWERMIVMSCLWVITVVLSQNMVFV